MKHVKEKWQRNRHAKSAQNPEMFPFLRPKAEEASSNRAANLLTCTDLCSCFFLTLSSPRSLLLPSLLRHLSSLPRTLFQGPLLYGCMEA